MAGRDRRSDADGTLILQLRPTHEQEGLADAVLFVHAVRDTFERMCDLDTVVLVDGGSDGGRQNDAR
ncbi:hypothetical protein PF007_g443 [Phytophthora fragariae]|uniref:Uncharacterized protein n=1 Tax=Phytophthora fragariae TaxID=53985 RepID=A0A6A3TUQ4_9STRA|nr:hypothetical protein PF009_g480 [Phytophthora fragariae]KAE9141000.1 hypothetical protein PF007_g443 [Phytophthora fragariae]